MQWSKDKNTQARFHRKVESDNHRQAEAKLGKAQGNLNQITLICLTIYMIS